MELQYPKFRWFVLTVNVILILGQGMLLVAPSPLIQSVYVSIFGVPEYADIAGSFAGQVSLSLMALWSLCAIIGSIIGGIFTDKYDVAKVFAVSTALLVIGAVIFVFGGNSLPILMIGRILGGLGSGPIIAMTPKVAAEWFPPQQRAMFNGVASAAFAGGVAIGLSVVEYHYGESEKDPRHLGAGYRHHHCIL